MLCHMYILAWLNISFIGGAAVHPKLLVISAVYLWIKIVPFLCIESEHISQHLQVVPVTNIIDRFVFCVRNNP